MKYETMLERFLGYVNFKTRSDANSKTIPSTPEQKDFLRMLKGQLEDLKLNDIVLNEENWFLTATLPANTNKPYDTIGFISHVDTADFNVEGINPQVVKNYDGGDIVLNKEKNIIMATKEFPNLKNYKGLTLITTDGTTLLGADDKAGVVEIIEAMKYLINHPEIKHGTVKVAFGPDEEIGRGADNFNVEEFGADFAYTMDGSSVGELQFECFNAAEAKIDILGKSVHPGDAKNKMINALTIARDIQMAMPLVCVPEKTECREGFIHLVEAHGNVENAELTYIIRDHSKELFEDIFEADKSDSDKFSDMIDWVCQFHESQTVFYGCPIGNLIVELSTEDENFRCPLNDFMTQWTEKLASLLQDLHADWSEERAQLQARQVISSIQGSIVILKVSQDIQVLENNMTDLKKNYC